MNHHFDTESHIDKWLSFPSIFCLIHPKFTSGPSAAKLDLVEHKWPRTFRIPHLLCERIRLCNYPFRCIFVWRQPDFRLVISIMFLRISMCGARPMARPAAGVLVSVRDLLGTCVWRYYAARLCSKRRRICVRSALAKWLDLASVSLVRCLNEFECIRHATKYDR